MMIISWGINCAQRGSPLEMDDSGFVLLPLTPISIKKINVSIIR